MIRHLLVDDFQSLREARAPDAVVWSCSPGLPWRLDQGERVRSPETLIDQRAFDDFGRSMLDARSGIAKALAAQEERDSNFAHLRHTQAAQVCSAFVLFATKGLILSRWLDATLGESRAVAGCPDLARPRGLSCQVHVHDHVYSALARELGRRMPNPPDMIITPPIDPGVFNAEFRHVPAFDKIFNIVNRTPSAALYRIWRKLGRSAASQSKPTRGAGTVLLFSDNEGIEESFAGLIRRGWRLVWVDMRPDVSGASSDGALKGVLGELERVWRAAVDSALAVPVAEAAWGVLGARIESAMSVQPAALEATGKTIAVWRERHGRSSRPLLALGSGLFRPHERLFDACLREAGIPVLCSDHGASLGLLLRHDDTAAESISFSDTYFTFNEEARSLCSASRRGPEQEIVAIGTPRIMSRSRFPRLQRAAGRRRVGVHRRETLLNYVASIPANNFPQGYGSCSDAAYAAFQRRLVERLRRFPGRVVVKPYPAHRFADRDQIWELPLPPNATLAPFGEFRHLRFAADLLLLDLASSTIGWALATDVPLIYVDSHHSATTTRATAAMRKGIFYVDSRQRGWEEEIDALICTPVAKLIARWQDMAVARRAFSERFVLGRRGAFSSGLLAALEQRFGGASRPSGAHERRRRPSRGSAQNG